jgi:hypothetical protein
MSADQARAMVRTLSRVAVSAARLWAVLPPAIPSTPLDPGRTSDQAVAPVAARCVIRLVVSLRRDERALDSARCWLIDNLPGTVIARGKASASTWTKSRKRFGERRRPSSSRGGDIKINGMTT